MSEIKQATVVSVEALPGFFTLNAEAHAPLEALPGQWGAFHTAVPNPAKPGEVLRRAWSFAEIGPTRFRLLVATVGPGTGWLATRSPGDTLTFTGPWGSRFRLDDGDGLAAFFAAGSGISPVGAMVDACVARGRPARLLWETPSLTPRSRPQAAEPRGAPSGHALRGRSLSAPSEPPLARSGSPGALEWIRERLERWRTAGVEVQVGPRLTPGGPGTWWFAGDGARLDDVVGDTPPERVERFYTPRPAAAA